VFFDGILVEDSMYMTLRNVKCLEVAKGVANEFSGTDMSKAALKFTYWLVEHHC